MTDPAHGPPSAGVATVRERAAAIGRPDLTRGDDR
jgi:hypothetical protein